MQTHPSSLNPVRRACAFIAGLVLAVTPFGVLAQEAIEIQCSPAVIYLGSIANGDWMTVHTDLPFALVGADASVDLSGIPSAQLYSDNCGNLVAKFSLTTLKAELDPAIKTLTLTLTVETVDETGATTTYEGSDDVQVVAPRSPAGGKQMVRNQNRNNAAPNPTPAPAPVRQARRAQR